MQDIKNNTVEILAPAKLNLVLEVIGKRPDGYHEIKSILQTIDLCDRIILEPAGKVSFECNLPDLSGENNLIYRAADLLKHATGFERGAKIKLEKQIPFGVGLGGGSSDAATALLALNKFWQLDLDKIELSKLAASLGSDVPFFLYGGTALIEGRGEIIIPLKDFARFWYLIVVPEIKLENKTRKMYSLLGENCFSGGQHVRQLEDAWKSGSQILPSAFYNVFDSVALSAFKGIDRCWQALENYGIKNIHVAGSGPSLFCAFDSESDTAELLLFLKNRGFVTYLTKTFESA